MPGRLVYFGGTSALSSAVLRRLLEEDCAVAGVVLCGYGAHPGGAARELPVRPPARGLSIATLAEGAGIPVRYIENPEADAAVDVVAALGADIGVVVCFPRRLPAALWSLPRHATFNLHPSLLPAYRGPAPLFWQLRHGAGSIGVSLHALDDGLDTGELVARRPLSLRDGLDHAAIRERVADAGVGEVRELLSRLETVAGDGRYAQSGRASYFPLPAAADFALDRRWSARRAFNFVRGTGDWRRCYPLSVGGRTWQLGEAVSFDPRGRLAGGFARDRQVLSIQFNPGILHARLVEA